jgi:hypothetical protein
MTRKEYPKEYSIVEVVFVDGTTAAFMINAGPSLAAYLTETLQEKGALVLRNETDAMVVPRERLHSFSLRKTTKET